MINCLLHKMKVRFFFSFLLSVTLTWSVEACFPYPTTKDGLLIKDCKPYKAIGVNYFDAFLRTIKNPKDKTYKKGLKLLARHNIPFIRVNLGGFWPKDWTLYLKNKEKYFQLLDEFIKTAETYNIGLIVTLFWNISAIPDLMNEPVSAWSNPNSKTVAFMKTYTKEIVSRYKDSPSIWVWEFTNELSNLIDLPGSRYPKTAPHFGTPKKRTKRDKLTWKDAIKAFNAFAQVVRELDPYRPLSSGNTMVRPFAYHLAFTKKWKKDSRQQTAFMLKILNPPSYNLLSVHIYPHHARDYPFAIGYKNLLDFLMKETKNMEKVLFVGEFGVCRKGKFKNPRLEKQEFLKLLKAIEEAKVPLAALWVYDRKKPKDPCNVTFNNLRAYQLLLIKEINKKLNY